MNNISLKVEKLNFGYDSHKILNDLQFQIIKGSFVSIIGPNGSGKTTLLKNISAALHPQSGKVLLKEKDIFKIKPKKLAQEIAVVPQDISVDFSFTVLETVLMGRMPYLNKFENESKKDIELAKWAMELTNTWNLRDRYITEISGGERQRVIVARALVQEPQVILLDEPVAHLDLQHQMELLELLRDLRDSNQLTIVAILHDLNLAAQFSDYIIMMKNGQIYSTGVPSKVLTADNIEKVYNMEVVVMPNELTGRFNIIPVAKSKLHNKLKKEKIHLICGGGTGAFLMEKLLQNNYEISCGVLNIGDGDWNKARDLGLEIAYEAPFNPISEKALEVNETLIKKSDVIILMPLPFGPGNLCNLEQVYNAIKNGKRIIVVGNKTLENRDFTDGKAQEIYDFILDSGAILVSETKDIFERI